MKKTNTTSLMINIALVCWSGYILINKLGDTSWRLPAAVIGFLFFSIILVLRIVDLAKERSR